MRTLTNRWAWWGAAAYLVAIVLLAAWGVSHHLPWSGHAAWLWSERDLPRLPDERENGWMRFEATAWTLGNDIPPRELRDVLDRLEWPRLVAISESIRTFADDAAVQSHDVAARAALASPRFADACAIDAATRCRYPESIRLHDLVVLGALSNALGGNWNEAFETAGVLLRADLDLMRTTRSAVSALMARRRVRRDLHLVGALLDGVASGARQDLLKQRADIAMIASILDRGVEPATDIERAIITEYVFVTKAIRQVSASANARVGADWWMPLFLDTERTCELSNRYFETLMRFGEASSTREPPPLPRYSHTHFGWWAYNAGGKLVLDAALVDLVPAVRQMEKQEVEIAAERNGVRERLRRFLENLPEGPPPQRQLQGTSNHCPSRNLGRARPCPAR